MSNALSVSSKSVKCKTMHGTKQNIVAVHNDACRKGFGRGKAPCYQLVSRTLTR